MSPAIPIPIDTAATVTAVRAPDAGETCGADDRYQLGGAPAPEVRIDRKLADSTPLTVGLAMPGFAASAITEGETLGVQCLAVDHRRSAIPAR